MNIKISYSDTISAFKGSAKKFLRFIFPNFSRILHCFAYKKSGIISLYREKRREKKQMKQIFSYLIPYRARMAVGFSIKVAATIVELLIPWALSIMVDKVIPTENIGFVFAWGGVMILFALLALLGNIVANRMASLVARNTTERIRLQLFSKISFLSARQQEQIGQASLISRSTSDTYNIHQFIGLSCLSEVLPSRFQWMRRLHASCWHFFQSWHFLYICFQVKVCQCTQRCRRQ